MNPIRSLPSCIVWGLLLAALGQSALNAQEESAGRTNLEVMQRLFREGTRGELETLPIQRGDSVALTFQAVEDLWIAESVITETISSHGEVVFVTPTLPVSGRMHIDITGIQLGVKYAERHREGILGRDKVERRISVGFFFRAKDPQTGQIVAAKEIKRNAVDTVDVNDIPSLEYPGAPRTHGELPTESILDRFIEPFVIIGATGAAVYLFFTIRS